MITHLSINNLKLHDHTDLELNGLTILTGMNGMGKSTVIQSLILLRQSFMMNDLDSGLNLKGDFGTLYAVSFASIVISIIPTVIFYLIAQEKVESSICSGVVKG